MNLERLYNNLSKLDVVDLAINILENDLGDFIADLNRSQLAEKGQREDGTQLSPEYTNVTKNIKSNKAGTSGIIEHVTLYDTGELHRSIFAGIIGDSLILDSKDSKVSELTEKYGEFLGLTDESIKKLQEKFEPIFIEKLENAILT